MHEFTSHRSVLEPLFADHRHLMAIRQAVLEGRLGRVWGDRPEAPTAARLDLGCYAILGGDPLVPGTQELIESVAAPKEFIYPDASWRRRILEVYGERLSDRPMESFSGAELGRAHLRGMAEGLPGDYMLKPLDVSSARQLDRDLEPHGLQTYPTPEALVGEGMAWGAFRRDREPRLGLACVASSYALSSRGVEVAISTRSEHRGRGLASAVAARFCLAGLERGLEPCWNASNPVSKRLARRLGFQPAGECEILFLTDLPGSG